MNSNNGNTIREKRNNYIIEIGLTRPSRQKKSNVHVVAVSNINNNDKRMIMIL